MQKHYIFFYFFLLFLVVIPKIVFSQQKNVVLNEILKESKTTRIPDAKQIEPIQKIINPIYEKLNPSYEKLKDKIKISHDNKENIALYREGDKITYCYEHFYNSQVYCKKKIIQSGLSADKAERYKNIFFIGVIAHEYGHRNTKISLFQGFENFKEDKILEFDKLKREKKEKIIKKEREDFQRNLQKVDFYKEKHSDKCKGKNTSNEVLKIMSHYEELQADEEAGQIMFHVLQLEEFKNLKWEDASMYLDIQDDEDNDSHPSRTRRLEAFKNGWKKARQVPNNAKGFGNGKGEIHPEDYYYPSKIKKN